MRVLRDVAFAAVLAAGALLPGKVAAQQATQAVGPDTVVFTPSRGKVTFAHGKHSKAYACTSCHHESRAEKPATSAQQKCGDCHTAEAVAPMKTTLRLAIHNTVTREGTCFNCHKKEAAAGKTTPSGCMDCHVKDD